MIKRSVSTHTALAAALAFTLLAILVQLKAAPPWWVHVLLWVPLTAFLTIFLLRIGKGLLLALEYRHRAREGRLQELE